METADSGQTEMMLRLIGLFSGRTCSFVTNGIIQVYSVDGAMYNMDEVTLFVYADNEMS